jgi:hypothetical protein
MKPQTETLTWTYSSTSGPGDANSRLETALAYAGFGWRVIPLHSPLPGGGCTCGRPACTAAGKHPRIKAWQRDASVDPDQIRAWWKQYPEANVGLLMGQASGVIAIDVDPRNGGEEALAELVARYGALPATVTALTGGGGIHYLFAAPSGRPVKKNNNGAALGPGLDLQGEGSLIVAAPSLHASGAHYKWASGCAPWERELAPLPAWVLALVDASQQRRASKAPSCATRATLPAVLPEGKRNDTLFRWACGLRARGLEEDEILARLIEENAARCKPPLPEADLRTIAHQAAKYEPGEAGQGEGRRGQRSVATALVEIAEAAGIEFWHTPERARFVSVPVGKHTEHWSLDSTDFREWLQDRLYQEEGRTAKRSSVDEALGVLGRWARSGPEHPIYTRVGEHDGAIYLDLADPEWRAVRVTPGSWEVVSNPPARFRRPAGQLALPTPERGGTLDELRTFINVPDEAWPLVAAWVLFALRPDADAFGDFPVLILGGQPGSAKSTTSSVLKRLLDPHKAELRGTIRNDHDLAVAAQHSWVVTLDNLSGIPVWLSDALCRLATGNGYSARALYTNDEEVVFYAKRPQIVNGIGDFATRSDLLDRALLINCPRIPDTARQTKTKFWPRFRAAWPRLLGAVLDALAGALAELPKVELAGAPRMSDFATFATAAARAGAFGEKDFWDAYGENRENAHALALEASPVAQAVLALLEDAGGKWEGTATGLLNALAGYVEPETRRLHAWPKKADGLSKALEGLAENLRAVGVTVTRNRTGRARVIMLTRSSDANVTPSDAKVTPSDANGDAKTGSRSQTRRGFAPNGDANDAKNTIFSVAPRGERESETAGESVETPEEKNTQNGVTGVTGVTAAKPPHPEPADDQDPVDDEEICACGRPADRYTPVGEPICSECVEAASARQEEAPTADGKAGPGDAAKPQNTESPGDDDAAACFCGKPADRVTATGKPICSECAELDDYFITPDTDLEEWWRRYGNAEDKGDE